MLAASARNVHASGRIGADSNATAGGSSWPVGTFPRPAFLAGKRPFREEEWSASSRRPWPRSATSGVPRKWGMTYELAVRPGAEQHNGVGSQGRLRPEAGTGAGRPGVLHDLVCDTLPPVQRARDAR